MTITKVSFRKFGGKNFQWADLTRTKREAIQVAKEYRKKGKLARVTKTSHGNYNIWVR